MEHLGVLVERIGVVGGSGMMMKELEHASGDHEWMPLAKLRDLVTETLGDVARGDRPEAEARLLAKRTLPVLEQRLSWYSELREWGEFRLARVSNDRMTAMVKKVEEHARTATEICEKLRPYAPED